MKKIGFLSFGHWTPQPQARSAADVLLQSIDLPSRPNNWGPTEPSSVSIRSDPDSRRASTWLALRLQRPGVSGYRHVAARHPDIPIIVPPGDRVGSLHLPTGLCNKAPGCGSLRAELSPTA
jgi:hypothetical protein